MNRWSVHDRLELIEQPKEIYKVVLYFIKHFRY